MRLRCACILWFQGDLARPVVDVLAEALHNGTEAERSRIEHLLFASDDPARIEAIHPLLEERLRGGSRLNRAKAARKLALWHGKAEGVLPALLAGLEDTENTGTWTVASRGVEVLGPKAAAAVPRLMDLFRSRDKAGVPNNDVLADALVATGPVSVPPLVQLLTAPKGEQGPLAAGAVAADAAAALGRLGASAARAVTPLLNHAETRVRALACRVLARTGPHARAAIGKLVERIEDPEEEVRTAALAALGELGPAARTAVPAVIAVFEKGNPDRRCRCLEALEKIRPDPAVLERVSRAALADKSARVRLRGLTLLWLARPRDPDLVPRALALLETPGTAREEVRLLERMGPDAAGAVPALIEMLADSKRRGSAIAILGAIGPPARPAVPALVKLLDPPDPALSEESVLEALRSIGGADPKVLVPIVEKLLRQKITIPILFRDANCSARWDRRRQTRPISCSMNCAGRSLAAGGSSPRRHPRWRRR